MKQAIFAPNQNHHAENDTLNSETQQVAKSPEKQRDPFFTQTPQQLFFNTSPHPSTPNLVQNKETIQRTYLEDGDPAPKNGADIEAPEIEWWKKNPYILDDKGNWRRVAREVVNNQRGERGTSHQVDPAHLREGARKTFVKADTKIFKVNGTDKFLKVVFNYDMIVTAFYMTSDEAKRAIDKKMSDVAWSIAKTQLPTVG
jgi:hypothetical protein